MFYREVWRVNTQYVLAILGFTLLSGCDGAELGFECSSISTPAISIKVMDKETGAPISCGTSIKVYDTDFSEALENPDSDTCDNSFIYNAAYDREGVYDIHISKDGYLAWSIYSVAVDSDRCNVNTENVIAYLEK